MKTQISVVDFFFLLTDFADKLPRCGGYLPRAWRGAVRICANLFLPLYFLATASQKKYRLDNGEQADAVVSFTSFPLRIGKVWLVVETLLRQTMKPKRIILWLSKDQFRSLDALPKRLLKQRERGLEIFLRPDDLRSHKKYFYVATELPQENFITVDDDIFYDSRFVEDLWEAARKNEKSVIGRWAKKVFWNSLSDQICWGEQLHREIVSSDLHFGGVGGCLYPKSSFFCEMLAPKLFMKYCPLADDIWLNVMCRLAKTKMATIKTRFKTIILPIIILKNVTLTEKNCGENLNDAQAKNVRKFCLEAWGRNPYQEVGAEE